MGGTQVVARNEARIAVAEVSENNEGKTAAALRKEIAALRGRCEEQLHTQRFLRQSGTQEGTPDR